MAFALEYQAFGNLSANGQTAEVLPGLVNSNPQGPPETSLQVVFAAGASGSVDVQARLDSTLAWTVIESAVTANKIIRVGPVYGVRLSLSGYSGSGNIGGGVLA